MSYEPHPSTIGYRAIQYLKTQPQGKWIASKPLAQALETDTTTLVSCLITVVKHGLVLREKRNGFWWFALGNDKTQKDAEAHERLVKAADPLERRPRPEPIDIDKIHRLAEQNNPFSGAAPQDDPEPRTPEPDPEPVAPTVEPAQDDSFKFSWSSDGVLTVSKGGQAVVMQPDEFQTLARFIDVIGKFEL